jgi:hypothetical protein
MRWRPYIVIGVPLALVLVIAAIVIVPRLTQTRPKGPEARVVTNTHLPTADITRLERALNSPDMHVQVTVMVPELANAYLAKGQPAYPAGSKVALLQGTSVCKKDICQAKAVVTQPSGKETTFLVYLSNALGKWLIFQTKES